MLGVRCSNPDAAGLASVKTDESPNAGFKAHKQAGAGAKVRFEFSWEDRWRIVYARELEVSPPRAPTIGVLEAGDKSFEATPPRPH